MAFGTRLTGVASLAAAMGAAAALAGVAVFTVSTAACAEPGQFVSTGDQVELVGGCLSPADLPPAPAPATTPTPGVDPFRQAP